MITFKLKANENQSKYWKLSLPAPYESRTDDVLQKLKLDPYSMEKNCLVTGVESELPLQHLVGEKINLHEATNLFQRLDHFPHEDMWKFTAVLCTNNYDLKDMINISLNIDCYELTDRREGVYTPFGQLVQINEPDMEKYNGISLPPAPGYANELVLAKFTSKDDPNRFGFRYLPAHPTEIEKTLGLIGCNAVDECDISYHQNILKPDFMESIRELDFDEVNRICKDVCGDFMNRKNGLITHDVEHLYRLSLEPEQKPEMEQQSGEQDFSQAMT